MKKLLFLLIPGFALAQSTNQNFVKTTTYRDQGATKPLHQVVYFDGLGRPIQKVDNAQSNSGKNIVTHIEYDAYGRQVKDYLPYKSDVTTLDYVTNPLTQLIPYYGNPNPSSNGNPNAEATNNPYSEKQLEASPLNRVLKQAAPGNDWAMGNGHEIKFDYQTNTDTEVKRFNVTTTWSASKALYEIAISNSENYQANQLYKTITKDENWTSGNNNTTQEFKDKEGRAVLKRTFNINTKGVEEKYDTYYVYDQYGNLTYVIPPLADDDISENNLNGLCYQYKYDYRNRLAAKKLPGKQWEYIVYDKLDRPVATGPAFAPLGTGAVGMMITQYDAFGRVTQTGWKAMSVDENSRGTWQNNINTGSNPFTLSTTDILTKKFYDNYSFSGLSVGSPYATNVKGLQTGSWVKVLDPTNPNASELSYTLYDYKYRPVVTHTTNYLGGYTKIETQLDWAGKTLSTTTRHKRLNGDIELVVKDMFEYTAQDRLSLRKQQINNGPEELIAKNTYDELGQLTSKNVGGNDVSGSQGLQSIDYKYNIRGWLTDINDVTNLYQGSSLNATDMFAFRIGYNAHNDIGSNDSQSTLLYNGNISEAYWRTSGDNTVRKYNYDYDSLNRLLGASYAKPQSSSSQDNYKEYMSYDKNGNILTLGRNGDLDSDGNVSENVIDDLEYTYHSEKKNQLMKVLDMSNSPKGFTDDSDGINDPNDDYEYDANGNLTKDENKNITQIIYNHLNLPTEIQFGSGNKIEYIYNALGQKVKKTIIDIIGRSSASIDYLTGFQYKDEVLQFFPHAEGYVNNTLILGESNYNYVFNYTDHLGNIRLSYGIDPATNTLKIIEENHYYPFGLKHTNYNSDWMKFEEIESGRIALRGGGDTGTIEIIKPIYNYKYNGKELQDELGLNVYDYGMMMYDPALGRRNNLDQLAEKMRRYSPYSYCFNNPMRFVDPDGMSPQDTTPPDWFVNNKTGAVVYVPGESKLTQATADKIGAGDAKNYDRLGGDKMFGDKVAYGMDSNILDGGAYNVENPEKFMDNQGYEKAEKVKIKETEFTSGGNMGGEERITQVNSDLKQIGESKITYVKDADMNKKTVLGKTEGSSAYSSSRSITYTIPKTVGQDNHVTAEYYSNRGTNLAAGATFVDKTIHVIKAILKSIK
ncbi:MULTISPECIES: DUF6443 domain-containing protein [Flavobacterium]|uniref:DUF6443 domain-containing protein n=1 Tax=Flavobacterium hankyongi TaxID=1176532 RepID=A0ABP9A973_9FLAO|nr:DUF6443 domain-containing protein [Flavobacterium sp. N1846]